MLGLSEKEKSAAARLRVRFVARANIEARRVCVVGPATRGSESARRNETEPRAYAGEIARAGPAVARTEGSRRIFCSGTGKHSPPQREYGKGAVVSSPRPHHGELSASTGFERGWCGGGKEGLEHGNGFQRSRVSRIRGTAGRLSRRRAGWRRCKKDGSTLSELRRLPPRF